MVARSVQAFKSTVRSYYRSHGRHTLPWRKTRDAYRILVSEVMLQQTQVKRVIPFYAEFTRRFPTVQKLASSNLSLVLQTWQGLGYNRRAKMLHDAAKVVMKSDNGRIPRLYKELVALPGVGDYTAKAVRVFALNEPEVLIETNIRTVFIHHFFKGGRKVSDSRLLPYIISTLDKKNPRKWYSALMDYGSHLKQTLSNPSRRSAHHIKQSPFKGSNREIRGAILKAHLKGESVRTLPFNKTRVKAQIKKLKAEGLI